MYYDDLQIAIKIAAELQKSMPDQKTLESLHKSYSYLPDQETMAMIQQMQNSLPDLKTLTHIRQIMNSTPQIDARIIDVLPKISKVMKTQTKEYRNVEEKPFLVVDYGGGTMDFSVCSDKEIASFRESVDESPDETEAIPPIDLNEKTLLIKDVEREVLETLAGAPDITPEDVAIIESFFSSILASLHSIDQNTWYLIIQLLIGFLMWRFPYR